MRGSTSILRGALGARVISLRAAPFESAGPVLLKPVPARITLGSDRGAGAEALAAGKDRHRTQFEPRAGWLGTRLMACWPAHERIRRNSEPRVVLARGETCLSLTSPGRKASGFACRPTPAGALSSSFLPLVMDLAPGRRRSGAFSWGTA